VVLSGRVAVPVGETVDEVVIMHGAATIDGVGRGALVVFDGPVTVAGEVTGDVVAFNGVVTVAEGAASAGIWWHHARRRSRRAPQSPAMSGLRAPEVQSRRSP
jgi:hypothetical protein